MENRRSRKISSIPKIPFKADWQTKSNELSKGEFEGIQNFFSSNNLEEAERRQIGNRVRRARKEVENENEMKKHRFQLRRQAQQQQVTKPWQRRIVARGTNERRYSRRNFEKNRVNSRWSWKRGFFCREWGGEKSRWPDNSLAVRRPSPLFHSVASPN